MTNEKVWVTDSYTWYNNPDDWYLRYIVQTIGDVPIRSDGRFFFIKSEKKPPPNFLCGIEWIEERIQ